MQRHNYVITSNRGHAVIKHAWNAARREIVAIVRQIARAEKRAYGLLMWQYDKGEDGEHLRGEETWTSEDARNRVTFTISKAGSA